MKTISSTILHLFPRYYTYFLSRNYRFLNHKYYQALNLVGIKNFQQEILHEPQD